MNKKTQTTRYDVAEYLRTPDEMAAYLEASIEEAHYLRLPCDEVSKQYIEDDVHRR